MQEFMSPWPPVVTFDFSKATESQKEVLARENAHCSAMFQGLAFTKVYKANSYSGNVWSPPFGTGK